MTKDTGRGTGYGIGMYLAVLATGAAYVALGLLGLISLVNSPPWLAALFARMDIMTALVSVLVGALLIRGARDMRAGDGTGGFVLVGSALGVLLASVALMIMAANGAELLLGNEELAGWSAADDLTPGLWMGIPSLVLLWASWRSAARLTSNSGVGG